MPGMTSYTQAAMERAMKVQEVMLQTMAKKISWWQAAEIRSERSNDPAVNLVSRQSLVLAARFDRNGNKIGAAPFPLQNARCGAVSLRSF
jgi:hypothetical protein